MPIKFSLSERMISEFGDPMVKNNLIPNPILIEFMYILS